MSIEKLVVHINLGGKPLEVGELVLAKRKLYFKYFTDFLESNLNISPLKLPFNDSIQSADPILFEGLFGVFFDSLPDSWGRLLLDRRVAAQGINPGLLSPLDRLSAIGRTGMGALEYSPSSNNNQNEDKIFGLDGLFEESQQIISGNDSDVLDELYILGGSSGGARPKILIGVDINTHQITYGSRDLPFNYEHWIIKFPSSIDLPDMVNIEFAYYQMAIHAGIAMSTCELFQGESGNHYFGTKRFDRIGKNRLHMHSASGIMHDDHRYSQLDYGHIMDCAFHLEKSVQAHEKVFRLAAFNVYSHNRDDHSKNFAFLMDQKGQWRFSPAYDLTFSSSAYGMHSTMIAGESKNPGEEQLLKLAKTFGLKNPERIIEEVKEAISQWDKFAKEAGVTKASSSIISKTIRQLIRN